MATESCTYIGRIFKALELKGQTLWIGVGRTTEWDDENNPDDVSPTAEDIEEAVVFVKASTSLVKRVDSGEDLLVGGVKFDLVDDGDAYDDNAHFVYVYATLDGPTMSYGDYRQKGIFVGLTPAAGHESDTWLDPTNVDDVGVLLYIANKEVVTYGATDTPTEHTVLEIR